jgi:RNA polymerase sigma-70 factor (ECF subfamily)
LEAPAREEVTCLLGDLSRGDSAVAEALFPMIYDELRSLASRYMKNERREHTLQATALVNEAYLKLVDQTAQWESRAHFFRMAARAMRQILVDHARRRNAAKPLGGRPTHSSDRLSWRWIFRSRFAS